MLCRYDSLFENSEWYNASKAAANEKRAQSAPSAARVAAPASAAAPAGTSQQLDILAQKRMLEEFLTGLPICDTGDSAAAPSPASVASTASVAPASVTVNALSGSECASGSSEIKSSATMQESPGAQLVRSFMSEMSSPADDAARGGALDSSLEAAAARPLIAEASDAGTAATHQAHDVKKRRSGPRLRLHEMRVSHVLSCLRRLGLEQYAPAFERCSVDGGMCDLLDEELLQFQLGVSDPAHRRTFLQWVDTMQHSEGRSNPS